MPPLVAKSEAAGRLIRLPFGYRAHWDGDLLVVRRPDGSLVAAFSVREPDPFEVEAAVWEDAD
jgi:hypothetical protein